MRETTKYGVRKSGVRHGLEVRQLELDDVSEYSAGVMAQRTSGRLLMSEGGVEFTGKMRDVEVDEKETAQFEVEVNKVVSSVSGEMIAFAWFRRTGEGSEEQLSKDGRFAMGNEVFFVFNISQSVRFGFAVWTQHTNSSPKTQRTYCVEMVHGDLLIFY